MLTAESALPALFLTMEVGGRQAALYELESPLMGVEVSSAESSSDLLVVIEVEVLSALEVAVVELEVLATLQESVATLLVISAL